MKARLVLAAAVAVVLVAVTTVAVASRPDERRPRPPGSHEVWMIDQSDSVPGGGGKLYVYGSRSLRQDRENAVPEVIDLGGAVRDLCLSQTGTAPQRPHMLVFNGGPSSAQGNTHAALSFVVSGHVVFFNAATRQPLTCIDAGTQAHAVWPTPDQRQLLVANQNGKLFQRIATNYATNTFTLDNAATLDLANGTTPSGALRQDPVLRPDNAPICPRTDDAGRISFVTLRGGGMFVVDHRTTPMKIVAEYDKDAVNPNGCGGIQTDSKMYINSGAGALTSNPGEHDVYAFDVGAYSTTTPAAPNTPAPRLIYSHDDRGDGVDSHGVLLTKRGKYLWVGDRIENSVTVVKTRNDRVVNEFSVASPQSSDPAPDLMDVSPKGGRVYVALRGPVPGSGGHAAVGNTPGLGVIDVSRGGKHGRLDFVSRISNLSGGQELADAHAVRVRDLRADGGDDDHDGGDDDE